MAVTTCSSRAGPRAAGAWKKAAWYGIGNSMCRIESLNYTSLLRMSIICSWVGRSRPEKHRWHVFSLLSYSGVRARSGGVAGSPFRPLVFGNCFSGMLSGPLSGRVIRLFPSARHESTGTPHSTTHTCSGTKSPEHEPKFGSTVGLFTNVLTLQ